MTRRSVMLAATFVAACFSGPPAWSQAVVVEAGSGAARSAGAVVEPASRLTTEQRLERLERMFEARSAMQLEMQSGLRSLQREVSELRGSLERQSYELEQITSRQRELFLELDRRLAQLQRPEPATPPSAPTETGYSADLDENQAYDQAVKLVLEDKNYADAIPAFEGFLSRFPNSSYAANAHYWLGQLLYNQGEADRARQSFVTVINDFSGSNKRADALLKLGLIAAQQNDPAQAKKYLQQVINEYPQSASAKLAKTKLTEL